MRYVLGDIRNSIYREILDRPEEGEVYDEEGRKDMVESDEMSAEEEGFMNGYEQESFKGKKKEDSEEEEDEKY